jgi:hypothetical protein
MIAIAFMALVLTVIVQTVMLQRAAARQQLLAAEAAFVRADAQRQRDIAQLNAERARAALDQMLEQAAQR